MRVSHTETIQFERESDWGDCLSKTEKVLVGKRRSCGCTANTSQYVALSRVVLVVMMVQERPNKEEGGSTGSEWDEKVTKDPHKSTNSSSYLHYFKCT